MTKYIVDMTDEEFNELRFGGESVMASRRYIPVTVDGEIAGILPQPTDRREWYEYQLTGIPDNNDPVFIKLDGSKYGGDGLPRELQSCSVALLDKIDGFIYLRTSADTSGTADADGPLVPLPARAPLVRVMPEFPLAAYRALVD